MSLRRLLWASPLPPIRSGVADYAAEILPHLRQHNEVRLVSPPDWVRPDDRAAWAEGPWADPVQPPAADELPVLHLGNNPHHLWIAGRLRRWGGVVVLHDAVLHHLLVEEAAAAGTWERFGRELEESHGEPGKAVAEARRWGYINRLDPFLFPARAALLTFARGVVVHNARAAAAVAAELPDLPVRQVPLAVAPLGLPDREAARQRLGVAANEVLLAHMGFLTPAKGLAVILLALAALRRLAVPARLVVVGEGSEAEEVTTAVRAGGLGDAVSLLGYAPSGALGEVVAAADLGLVPRYPTAGETSAAVLRFLAAGTPVVVAGYGQFLEFPPEAAQRISPGRAGVGELTALVRRLAGKPALGAGRREAARRAWQAGGHDPAVAAAALAAALEELA